MNLSLFDGRAHKDLLPLTFTRPVSELRIGINTVKEKWDRLWPNEVGIYTLSYLSEKYPNANWDEMIFLSAAVCPNQKLLQLLLTLKLGQKINWKGRTIAFASSKETFDSCELESFEIINLEDDELTVLSNPGDLFEMNDREIRADIFEISKHLSPQDSLQGNTVLGNQLYVEDGVYAQACVFNTESGPIYLGKNTKILEGSVIRGPFAICEEGVVKMAAKIYGATTIGPHSKVGGEVSNVIIQGYSNKGHDGYLGNSVIGEWCNLGADTNCSNLKNNYSEIKTWSYSEEDFVSSGRQFQGLVMGDHSKTGINTMLNTGTTVGVSANIFGTGFPSTFIPSFTWGGLASTEEYRIDKAFEVAEKMMERRKLTFSNLDREILSHIFKITGKFRT